MYLPELDCFMFWINKLPLESFKNLKKNNENVRLILGVSLSTRLLSEILPLSPNVHVMLALGILVKGQSNTKDEPSAGVRDLFGSGSLWKTEKKYFLISF